MTAIRNHSVTVSKRILTLKECVDEYGVSLWFWRSRIWDGSIPYISVGRKQLLDRQDIDEFIKQSKLVNGV